MEVKDIIYAKRIEHGLTMKQLADLVGVSEGTISRWESGDIENMRRDKIARLAKALGISPAVIMGWEEEDAQAAEAGTILGRAARDPDQIELLKNYQSLDAGNRDKLLQFSEALTLLP